MEEKKLYYTCFIGFGFALEAFTYSGYYEEAYRTAKAGLNVWCKAINESEPFNRVKTNVTFLDDILYLAQVSISKKLANFRFEKGVIDCIQNIVDSYHNVGVLDKEKVLKCNQVLKACIDKDKSELPDECPSYIFTAKK